MNNDAKDLIGDIRATNLLIILLHVEKFDFPLDSTIASIIKINRDRFMRIIDLASELTSFQDHKQELLSAIDDIYDSGSDSFYTRDTIDMLLSLYAEDKQINRLDYDNVRKMKEHIKDVIYKCIGKVFQDVMWIRVSFYSHYPTREIPSLRSGWFRLCETILALFGSSVNGSMRMLMIEPMQKWLSSELVCSISKKRQQEADTMPHIVAYSRAIVEVEYTLNSLLMT